MKTADQTFDSIIYKAAVSEGITPLLAEFMVAQAKHESNLYQSNVFKTCNNAFGYKYVGQSLAQACTGSPEGDNYAKYKSVEDSAKEVARWIKRRWSQFEHVKTPEEYAVVLERNGYFGDNLSVYQKALNKFWHPIKGMANTAITKYPTETVLTGITFVSLLSYYIIKIAKKRK